MRVIYTIVVVLLILFVITFLVNSIARWVVNRRKDFSGAN